MSLENDNNKMKEVAEELRRYYNAGETAYVAYEIGNKKALLMINSAANQVFYIDKHGRPLLELETNTLLAELPGIKIIDISRLESNANLYNRSGFHANQPIYTDLNWLDNAKEKIQTYSNKENVAERYQTANATQVGSFFNKTKPLPVSPDASAAKDSVLKDTTNKPRNG
ncbi:MAG: hypothetical protein V4501_06560 [Pseudomonadota bacterium]